MGSELAGQSQSLQCEMEVGVVTLRAGFVDGTNRQIKWMVTFAAGGTALLLPLVRLMA